MRSARSFFGKWHLGFRSTRHLPARRGFTSSFGSLQTGGAYQGPAHNLRWQDEHPVVWDDDLVGPPDGCNVYAPGRPTCDEGCPSAFSMCSSSSFLNSTQLQCNTSSFVVFNTSSAAQCCGQCALLSECTYWVFAHASDGANGGADAPPCSVHFDRLDAGCYVNVSGSTSGLAPPAPPRNRTCTDEYSTDLWGQLALQSLVRHDPSLPFYLHLCFEAVHTPYDPVPGVPTGIATYQGMLWRADVYVGALVATLEAKHMLNTTLILYTSDNGGTMLGNNYPLRGEKHSSWEGAMRTAAFVSGGLIPPPLRGTSNGVVMHLVDWCRTRLSNATTTPRPLPRHSAASEEHI
jgi:hypothetical protein